MEEDEKKRLSSKEIAKESGISPLTCPNCGKKCGTDDCLRYFFKRILEHVKNGREVAIPHFGSFRLGVVKGRKMTTPLMNGGTIEFGDRVVLRFHQHKGAKEFLNDDPKRDQTAAAKKKAAKKPAKKAGKKG